MDSHKFIWCRDCDAIHHVTRFDKSPLYAVAGEDVEELQANDWRDFMDQHPGHKLEPLTDTGELYSIGGSFADPMGIAYVEVTDGERRFLLRRARTSIEEPLKYELANATIIDDGLSLEVQENEIRKEIKYHFISQPAPGLSDGQIDLFIALFKEVAKTIDPAGVKTSEPCLRDDSVSYGLVDEDRIHALMMKCAAYFSPADLESIHRFVEGHREGCDVLTLVLRRRVAIQQVSF